MCNYGIRSNWTYAIEVGELKSKFHRVAIVLTQGVSFQVEGNNLLCTWSTILLSCISKILKIRFRLNFFENNIKFKP